jgi:hypothetical protein
MTKLEEVARAIDNTFPCPPDFTNPSVGPAVLLSDGTAVRKISADAARAAIQALMEPSEGMKMAGAQLKGTFAAMRMIKPTSTETWQAMLTAALEEK